MRSQFLFLAVLLVLLLSATTPAAGQNTEFGAIDRFIEERMAALDIPGAALAIVQGGEIVYLEGYDVANPSGDPVTPQSPFLLASLSKSMTAVAVLQRVEAGQVELDAPIQRYLPWFMPETPITVRQLLNQTSGLDEKQGYERNLDPDGVDALENSVRGLASAELNHVPSTAYEYSNSNYDVLGHLIEAVTGQSYGDYLENHLFQPLEMTHSFTDLAAARAAGMSSNYYPFFGRQTAFDSLLPYSRATQPSAGVIGSAEDMAHYLLFHLNDGTFRGTQLLSPSSMEILHAPAVFTDPTGEGAVQYAMGWAVWPFTDMADAPVALSHGGGWLGVNHNMLIIPEKGFGMVLLLNSSDPTHASDYANIAFDVALLALDQAPQHFATQEDWLTRHLRPLGVGLTVFLLVTAGIAVWRLRQTGWRRSDSLLFIALALIDLALIIYLLAFRLPQNTTNVSLVVRFEPDLGLLLVLQLLLTIGWGSGRSFWAIRRWQSAGR
ncbi:MAG: beta-lactamase family protein [Anaerolineae bacterium]|nr:beta-lactamase family protein [Anaerolineae bacterium]